MSSLREQKIQLYLMRLTARLFGMSRREKDEIRQEVRLHLDALIATQEFEGKSEAEAVEIALDQFGDPRKIGKEMARSWWKKQKRQWAAETAAREAAKPAGQRRREQAIRWLASAVWFTGFYVFMSVSTRSTPSGLVAESWSRILTVAFIWGLTSGFVTAIHPDCAEPQPFPISLQERREEWDERDQRRLALPQPSRGESFLHRIKHHIYQSLSGWTRRQRQALLRQATQPLPPLDWGKVFASIFWVGVVLVILSMLPLDPVWKRVSIAYGLMWKVDSLSQLLWRRLIARRRLNAR